jgi:sugar/nucleoside kinase (ribokinase family)
MTPDLVVLGNLALDDIVYEDGATRMAQPGGATLYAALGARLWEIEVGMVTRVGENYPPWVLDTLTERGIDLAGVRPLTGPGLRTWLLYEGGRRRVVHRLEGPTHREASPVPDDIPGAWKSRAFHLAPMPFALQRELVGALSPRGATLLSLDPYELVVADNFEAWRQLLGEVDIFLLSEDEMEVHRGRGDPRSAVARLGGGRLRLVLYKRGARGGLAYEPQESRFSEWTGRCASIVDTTGAGDAFAGGLLAGQLLGDPLPRALERGVVTASFALEGQGPEGLLATTPDAALNRLSEWFGT